MRNIASLNESDVPHRGGIADTACKSAAKAARSFVAAMMVVVAHERSRRQLARLDMRMLQDIGLEPFEVYYGWRGPGR